MNVLIAIDSFKGSMSSMEAGRAAAEGIRRACPSAVVEVCPLADGGEGTVDALAEGMGGRMQRVEATGPLGTPTRCKYAIAGETAVIETAEAAGLSLVPPGRRNPLHTTTYGIGEIIKDAVGKGCRKFIIGLGGSATNDGGIGMLQALGFDLLDAEGNPVPYGAKGLEKLAFVSAGHALPQLAACEFHVACDVKNLLCGPEGCSAVFGPQKGADKEMVRQMDGWMASYAGLVQESFPRADALHPGVGAAGGLGFAFLTFLNASLEPGVEIVLRETGLEEKVRAADLVVTGEGRLDGQSVMGKAPSGVARIAKKYGKRVIALAGCIGEDAGVCNAHGIDAYFSILRSPVTLKEAMAAENAKMNMEAVAEQVFRLVCRNGSFQCL